MARKGKETREYKSVLEHKGVIGYVLKATSGAIQALTNNYHEKEWIDITESPDEISLVRLALTRISLDASQYQIFMEMLKDTVGMKIVVKGIQATYNGEDTHSEDSTQPPSEDTPLDIYDLIDIKREVLTVEKDWKCLGQSLRLNPELLDKIHADHVRACLTEVLTLWLKKEYNIERFGSPSWKRLVAAVSDPAGGNNRELANQIAKKYGVPPS